MSEQPPERRIRLVDHISVREVVNRTLSTILAALIIGAVGLVAALIWNKASEGGLVHALKGVTQQELEEAVNRVVSANPATLTFISSSSSANGTGVDGSENNTSYVIAECIKGKTAVTGGCRWLNDRSAPRSIRSFGIVTIGGSGMFYCSYNGAGMTTGDAQAEAGCADKGRVRWDGDRED
jgi:hypothetical protein